MDERVPSSFAKSLFFGHIPESMVIPYPRFHGEERERVRELLRRFREFAAAEIDSARIDREESIPEAVIEGLRQLGFFGLAIEKRHGGLGLSTTGYARLMQEVGGTDGAIAMTLSGHESLGCMGLVLHGTDEQKARYLPRLASGELIAAFGLTEPTAGSDAASVRSRAELQPDGSFILDGSKSWITNGGLADLFTIFAQTRVERDGVSKDRITAFLVERGMGLESGPKEPTLGVRGASTTSLLLKGVRVPKQNVLGQVGGGFKVAMSVLNSGRLSLAASSVGQAKQLIRLAISRVTARRQFGRSISDFGLIRDKIARMMVECYAAESMVYLTTGLIDRGVEDYSLESAMCKVFGSEMLWRVVNESLQIAAGMGYMREFPYERYLRDARINHIYQGTSEILRCFIALSGLQGPGDRLAQLAEMIKFPLKGYGLAIDFVVDKLKTQYYGGERLDHAHSALKREAVLFEDWVPELAKAVEKTLRKHGGEISEMQFVQRRIADVSIDLYQMIAVIARTSASLLEKGPDAEREAKLCRAACGRAARRIQRKIRKFDDNDDELLKAIANDTYEAMEYPFDVVLG
jgi:acyl-CoA dehydrogenase family protein 9